MKHTSRLRKLRDVRSRRIANDNDERKYVPLRLVKRDEEIGIGSVVGCATGEQDRDPMAGGWEGTDDATSTAPADLSGISRSPTGRTLDPDIEKEGDNIGDISDLEEINIPRWHAEGLFSVF